MVTVLHTQMFFPPFLQIDSFAPEQSIQEGERPFVCQRMTLSAYPLLFRWEGKAEGEKGIEKGTGKVRVEVDPKYYRPTEVVSGGLFQQDLWQP